MCLISCTNLLTKTDFPLPVGPEITLPPQYSQSNEEEPYYILKTNNPYTFYVPDGYDPDPDTHHCSVDTDELFHAYFFYVST
jgi:hypothetical protein